MINKYDIEYKNTIDHKDLMKEEIITDIYKKCKRYNNNVFNIYDKTKYDTLYAIGDIHGDYDALIQILEGIECIVSDGKKYKWNPEKTNVCIVQIGDIIDGYRPEIEKYDEWTSGDLKAVKLMLKLRDEAEKYKSRIILLYGNHEIRAFFRTIDNFKIELYNKTLKNVTEEEAKKYNKKFSKLKDKILCNYQTICIVNDYIFCHSGFILNIIEKLISMFKINREDFINLQVNDKLFLINVCAASVINYILNGKFKQEDIEQIKKVVMSIYDHREYDVITKNISTLTPAQKLKVIQNLNESKILLNAKGMIIGHNTSKSFEVNDYKELYNIDVKISEAYGNHHLNKKFQILQIRSGKPTILSIKNKRYKEKETK